MRTGNLKAEKLMRIRLKTSMCKVCRVDFIFSYTFNYQFLSKKCEKRVYVPCTPCTSPTGACQQMQKKMLSTLHTLHRGGGGRAGQHAGRRGGPA